MMYKIEWHLNYSSSVKVRRCGLYTDVVSPKILEVFFGRAERVLTSCALPKAVSRRPRSSQGVHSDRCVCQYPGFPPVSSSVTVAIRATLEDKPMSELGGEANK